MLLILGLGNPGPRFEHTRHNVGFDVVRRVAGRKNLTLKKRLFRPYEWSGRGELVLALPLTYMNRSGLVIPSLMKATGASAAELLVVCDNLDLPAGSVRIKRRGSSRSHNGLSSVMDALGTGEFARLYVGIGRPHAGRTVVEHVLSRPGEDERDVYEQAIGTAADTALALEGKTLETVMSDLNQRT